MKKPIKAFAGKYDYTAYGGSPLLGVNGAVIKAHGSSDATAIKNAVFAGYEYGQSKIISEILEKGLKKIRIYNRTIGRQRISFWRQYRHGAKGKNHHC